MNPRYACTNRVRDRELVICRNKTSLSTSALRLVFAVLHMQF